MKVLLPDNVDLSDLALPPSVSAVVCAPSPAPKAMMAPCADVICCVWAKK